MIRSFVIKIYEHKARLFEKATRYLLQSQQKLLLQILRHNSRTVYGKKYGFADIKTIEGFQSRVPINTYETLRPYIGSMIEGKKNVLSSQQPILFGITSGTMGKPKYIPVTRCTRKKKQEVMAVWAYYIIKDHPSVLDGKILALVSPEKEGCVKCGIPYGAESGHGYKNMPAIVRRQYAIPYEAFEIKDYDSKYYCILRIAMEQNISAIASLNPSTILLLCQKIERFKDDIIKDIRGGRLKEDLKLPHDIRRRLEKNIRPDPKRAQEIESIIKAKGRLLPQDLWPNLKIVACWKGGSVGAYLPNLRQYLGDDVVIRDFGYLSSEARVSIPICDEGCGGVLAITTNFYEFISVEEKDRGGKRPLLAHELEKGKEYYIILTTHGGLYRYDIDDIIRVAGYFNDTPIIEFRQKGSLVSSVTGEKLYEAQVDEAVKKAAELIGVSLNSYSAFVERGGIPRYAFLIEFAAKNLPVETKRELLRYIEKGLNELNIEYAAKRISQRLSHPCLKIVESGSFESYRTKLVAQGRHDGQFKIPKLTNDENFCKGFNVCEEIEL